jgi:hypothetical protein
MRRLGLKSSYKKFLRLAIKNPTNQSGEGQPGLRGQAADNNSGRLV